MNVSLVLLVAMIGWGQQDLVPEQGEKVFRHLEAQANSDVQTVSIECPNIACRSRFSESLNENIVGKHDWVHSVKISYSDELSLSNAPMMGATATLVFEINKSRKPVELVKTIVESRYYLTDDWSLIERRKFSDIK